MVIRIVLWLFSRTCYRVTTLSPDNVPGGGGALLISNHVSFVDMLLILASTRRYVRFPILATGKRDLRTVRELATRLTAEKPTQE